MLSDSELVSTIPREEEEDEEEEDEDEDDRDDSRVSHDPCCKESAGLSMMDAASDNATSTDAAVTLMAPRMLSNGSCPLNAGSRALITDLRSKEPVAITCLR